MFFLLYFLIEKLITEQNERSFHHAKLNYY